MDAFRMLGDLLGGQQLTSASGRQVFAGSSPVHGVASHTAVAERTACPCCGGKGGFDTWARPCETGHMHYKMDCPTCEGRGYFPGAADYVQCQKCEGKGGFDVWGKPCLRVHMHFKSDCPACDGKCYFPPPPVPEYEVDDYAAAESSAAASLLGGLIGSALGHYQQRHAPEGLASATAEPLADLDVDHRNEQATVLIRALVNAAKCDGRIDEQEQQRILARMGDVSKEEYRFLLNEFAQPVDVDEFARSVPVGMERQVYSLSLTAIDLDTSAEADYLRNLAAALRLPSDACNEIHQRLGAPAIF